VIQNTPTLREMTADRLREAIFTMHFKPNDRLVERDLCDQTGVSRTCVREALRHLESEGLVERRSNKGLYVTVVTPAEAQQIFKTQARRCRTNTFRTHQATAPVGQNTLWFRVVSIQKFSNYQL